MPARAGASTTAAPPARADLTGLILAGGQGRRLGGADKGLLPWAGRPLVEWAIAALERQVRTLAISANRHAPIYAAYGYPVIADRQPGYPGPLAGLASALREIRDGWVLCVPCDTPYVPPDLGVRLAAALANGGAEIAMATDGIGPHPLHALIPVALADSLERYLACGERSVLGWYRRHRVVEVDFSDSPQSFANLNTLEDGQRLSAWLERQPADPTRGPPQTADAGLRETVARLAGGLAHDFNNLIGVVSLNLEYLQTCLAPDSASPQIAQILEETRLATQQARLVAAGLLALSRRPRAAAAADLTESVQRLVRALERQLPRGIALVARIEPQVCGLADPILVQSALLQLFLNARDAMAGQGRLEIALARVHLTAPRTPTLGTLEAGDYAQLTVADSGSGMPPEILERIFQPLFSTKARGRGTGLGLFVVRELVLGWGGGLEVQSAPGRGSRFRLYLPACAAAAQAQSPERGEARAPAPARILVVDDDSSMRLILTHLLEHAGYCADEAGDGVQALARLESGTAYDLVLCDIVMPGMDGIELQRRLACDYPRLPVILMSADEQAGPAADTEILFKPQAHRLLEPTIQARLARARDA